MIVVDTSALVSLFRGHETIASQALESILRAEVEFGVPLPCLQEILQGAKIRRELDLLDSFLSKQTLLSPRDSSSYRSAAKIGFDCRRRGNTVRSTIDCLVAQITLELGGKLLHEDRDYFAIQKVRPLKFLL